MNERVFELAKQATSIQGPTPYNPLTFEVFDKEKFAELIVRECAKVAVFKDSGTVATTDVAGHIAAGRSIAARLIKEHFGVEE
jgi:hypothetical protein